MEEFTVKVGFGIAFVSFLFAFCLSTVWLWGCVVGAVISLFGLFFMEG